MDYCRNIPLCKRKAGMCTKPNPWIEFLVDNGGKGFTRRQLSRSYRAHKPMPQIACRLVRNRGEDHKRNATDMFAANACTVINNAVNRAATNMKPNMLVLRRKAVALASKHISVNFAGADLTDYIVEVLIDIVDKIYWNHTLMETLETLPNVTFESRVVNLPLVDWEGRLNQNLLHFELEINQHQYTNGHGGWTGVRETSGLMCQSKLDCLLLTIHHELIHMVTRSQCLPLVTSQGQGGHGLTWRRLWHSYQGGSINRFTFTDVPDIIDVE